MNMQAAQNLAEHQALHSLEKQEQMNDALNEYINQNAVNEMFNDGEFAGIDIDTFWEYVAEHGEPSDTIGGLYNRFLEANEGTIKDNLKGSLPCVAC